MAKRDWAIMSNDYATEDEFRSAVVNELAALENIGHRLGFAVSAVPIRERLSRSFVTTGWAFRTDTVPAVQKQEPAPEAIEPEAVETAF